MSIWDEKLLGDFCTEITVGFVGTQSKFFVDQGIPLIRGQNVKEYELDLSEPKFIPAEIHEGWKKSKLAGGDIVIVRVGYPGTAAVIPENFGDCNCASVVIVRTNKKELNPYFATYFINSPKGKARISGMLVGSAQQVFNAAAAKTLKLPVPPIDEQNKVVDALDKYTLLIKNNNRRIAILEDMAQSLYREWFVNFRYPNHEDNIDTDGNPKLVDSPLGQVPEGWEVKTAAEAITINPRTKLAKDGEKPFVGMSGLSESSMVINDIIEKSGNSGAKFINGDTLFARITPCLQNGKTGYVQFLNEEQPVGFGSTEFIVLRESEDLSSECIYLLSRSNNFREHAIKSMTGATGRQRVHPDSFASYCLAVPPKDLMAEFTKLVKPMFKSIYNLSKSNENLKKQRNMLLPKLISGQVELKD